MDPLSGSCDARASLRGAGLRVTAPRLAVMEAVLPGTHVDADQVAATVRSKLGTVSTQAIYDTLRTLVTAGMLRMIQPAGSPRLFEVRTGDNHHHAICRSCLTVVDVDCRTDQVPCLETIDPKGYQIDEAEIVYWGQCPNCQASQ